MNAQLTFGEANKRSKQVSASASGRSQNNLFVTAFRRGQQTKKVVTIAMGCIRLDISRSVWKWLNRARPGDDNENNNDCDNDNDNDNDDDDDNYVESNRMAL